MADKGHAFTLIELLVVVAIISILAAIAVPNFLQAHTRAKVARILADTRSLVTALESYAVDNNNKYPFRHNTVNMALKPWAPTLDTRAQEMSVLTTPISYMTTLPRDIFDKVVPRHLNLIDYYDEIQTEWTVAMSLYPYPVGDPGPYMLVSVGPDGYLGVLSGGEPGGYPPQGMARLTIFKVYDPTNGTISYGNIFRFQGGRDPQTTLHR